MNSEIKLSTLSMECVLERMDYFQRISLSKRCPTIQKLDIRTPSHINVLKIGYTRIKINKTALQIGVIQHYDDHNTPDHIIDHNRRGGCAFNVDRYGFEIGGALSLFSSCPFNDWQEDILRYQEEKQLVSSTEAGLFRRMSLLRLERKIKKCESELLPYTLRDLNQDPEFSHYLQLRITNDNSRNQKLERLEYKACLFESMDYLFKRLFSKRKMYIKKVEIEWLLAISFPFAQSFISNMDVQTQVNLLEVNEINELDFRILQNAGIVPIINKKNSESPAKFGNFLKMNHRRVNLSQNFFECNDLFLFIHICRGAEVPYKQHFSLQQFRREEAIFAFNIIKHFPGATIQRQSKITDLLFNEIVLLTEGNGSAIQIHSQEIMKAGGTDDNRRNILYFDTLYMFFEGVADIIDLNLKVLEHSYGLEKLKDFISILQVSIDEFFRRLLEEFDTRRRLPQLKRLVD